MTYEKLFKYIDYFENDKIQFFSWKAGYPSYDQKFLEFIDTFYEVDLIKQDYMEHLAQQCSKGKELKNYIWIADMELLVALLTYYVRQERFCDGLWIKAIKDKVFLQILYRLQELSQ